MTAEHELKLMTTYLDLLGEEILRAGIPVEVLEAAAGRAMARAEATVFEAPEPVRTEEGSGHDA